eukprot:CAMPEP_0170497428 /NCGR_PEP_ID=MMETSP0208-20121228/24752_1 /TAXON_ID=197538 /ORGANISM="Strombidium inclinatum, Strain S3" /LENGTH=93 /DNA_ID=CAMNT_0010774241 /DNA_START=708 /DNA_END=986 /DNA_ORIENTATION=+
MTSFVELDIIRSTLEGDVIILTDYTPQLPETLAASPQKPKKKKKDLTKRGTLKNPYLQKAPQIQSLPQPTTSPTKPAKKGINHRTKSSKFDLD